MSEPFVVLDLGRPLGEEAVAELKERLAQAIARPHQIVVLPPRGPQWVLVKGWHDSGAIEAVYGPYTKERAEWLLSNMLDGSTGNWTLAELQTGPSA